MYRKCKQLEMVTQLHALALGRATFPYRQFRYDHKFRLSTPRGCLPPAVCCYIQLSTCDAGGSLASSALDQGANPES